MDKHRQWHKLTATHCETLDSFVDQICDFEHTRGFIFHLIMFIVNISEYIQVFFFLSYGTLVDFVTAIDCSVFQQDCCFAAHHDCQICNFEYTSSLEKRGFIRPLIEFILIMFKWFWFLFLKWHAG